jgi:drug/metabolite transporter (DMT)-like permease
MKSKRTIGLIMIISGAALWGLSGPMLQWLFHNSGLSPVNFLFIRLLLAGAFILSYLYIKNRNVFTIWKHPKDWLNLLLFGVLGMLGAQFAFIEALHVSNAVTAMLFQFFGPVLITIYVAFQNKKLPSLIQFLAVLAALIGLFFMMTNGSVEEVLLSREAIVFGILTMLGFTFYTLHPTSLINKWGTIYIVGWGMLIGGLFLFLSNERLSMGKMTELLSVKSFIMMISIITIGTLSFLLYIGSLNYLSPTETSILASIEPLVAVILSITWLKESFGSYQLIGGILIILSVIFLSLPSKKEKTYVQENIV